MQTLQKEAECILQSQEKKSRENIIEQIRRKKKTKIENFSTNGNYLKWGTWDKGTCWVAAMACEAAAAMAVPPAPIWANEYETGGEGDIVPLDNIFMAVFWLNLTSLEVLSDNCCRFGASVVNESLRFSVRKIKVWSKIHDTGKICLDVF